MWLAVEFKLCLMLVFLLILCYFIRVKYESEILKAMHQEAKEMYKIGAITEASMREYDEMCLSNPKKNKSSSVYANNNSVNTEQIRHATA